MFLAMIAGRGTYIVGYMGTYNFIPYIVTKFQAAQVRYPFHRYLVMKCSDSTWPKIMIEIWEL